jgi:cytoskeletal protein RodZ
MPPSLGQKLKNAREQQGLSLADVAHKTRIPVPKLRDLEDDNYNTFGSLTYARCFLQTYGGFVGVDANPVTVHMYPTPLGGTGDYRYLTESLGGWVGAKPDRSLMPDPRPVRSSRAAVVVVAVVGAVLVGGGLWAKAFFTDLKSPVAESRSVPLSDLSRDRSVGDEEVRATAAVRATEPVPIRRALPVEDDPKSKTKTGK